MNNNNLVVGNIQRICFHDGPGIRTTVFLKGCPLRCPWCANPENLSVNIEYLVDIDKCNNKECPYGLECNGYLSNQNILFKNLKICPLSAIRSTGLIMSTDKLFETIMEDKFFYQENGGVTFSGGEPLFQADGLIQLFQRLRKEKINICIETSLGVKKKQLDKIIDLVDIFIVDIKILVENEAKKLINMNLVDYFNNIDTLFQSSKEVIFRIPIIDSYTYTENNKAEIISFLKKYKPQKVEIFKNHNLAEKKYYSLNKEFSKIPPIEDTKIYDFMKEIEKLDINVEIIKF